MRKTMPGKRSAPSRANDSSRIDEPEPLLPNDITLNITYTFKSRAHRLGPVFDLEQIPPQDTLCESSDEQVASPPAAPQGQTGPQGCHEQRNKGKRRKQRAKPPFQLDEATQQIESSIRLSKQTTPPAHAHRDCSEKLSTPNFACPKYGTGEQKIPSIRRPWTRKAKA